jgi:hypothetical protein
MRAILLGLTLLCACSSGSDLLEPSGPATPPNMDPHPFDQGTDIPGLKVAPSQTTHSAIVRAPR